MISCNYFWALNGALAQLGRAYDWKSQGRGSNPRSPKSFFVLSFQTNARWNSNEIWNWFPERFFCFFGNISFDLFFKIHFLFYRSIFNEALEAKNQRRFKRLDIVIIKATLPIIDDRLRLFLRYQRDFSSPGRAYDWRS